MNTRVRVYALDDEGRHWCIDAAGPADDDGTREHWGPMSRTRAVAMAPAFAASIGCPDLPIEVEEQRPRCPKCGSDNVTIRVVAQVERDGVVCVVDSDEPNGPQADPDAWCRECESEFPLPPLAWSAEHTRANLAAGHGPRLRAALDRLHQCCVEVGMNADDPAMRDAAACLRFTAR